MPRYFFTAMIVAVALFMENMDATVISTSLPAIAADLHEDPLSLKLALTSYLLSLAVFIPASGWMADRYGARTVFGLAIGVFTLGSVCCGLSSSLPAFVASRILQGAGGAMMVPVGRLVLLRSVARQDIVRALSTLTMAALVGPVVGPPLGGFITTYFHWRWIFWVNVPIGAIGIVLAMMFIDNIREDSVAPLDRRGFLLSGSGLGSLIFGLTVIGRGLLPAPVVGALIAYGLVTLTLYIRHARKAAFPILDLKLLALPSFRASVMGGSLFRISIGAIPLLLPLMLQVGFGMNAFHSGLTTFVSSAGAMLMKVTAAPILSRVGFRRVLIFNGLLSAALLGSYGFLTAATPVIVTMTLLLVGGFFRSLEFTALNALAYADIDTPRMSKAVSFYSVAQQVALSLGVTIGAGLLQVFRMVHGGSDLQALDFAWAFITVAALSACSTFTFLRLPADVAAEMAGRSRSMAAAPAPAPAVRAYSGKVE